MSERKNIKRNANRPKAKDTPFNQGRGHGVSRDKEELELAEKLRSWEALGKQGS